MRWIRKPVFLVSASVLVIAAYALGWSKLFVVESIKIESKDKKVVKEVLAKISQAPAVVEVGQPLARVDRKEIANRLREMLWVENVRLDRNMISGELSISIIARNPIGRLIPKDSTNVVSVGFLDRELEYFYLPLETVNRALAAGEWEKLPELSLRNEGLAVRQDVATLLEVLAERSIQVVRVEAKDELSISTKVIFNQRKLDIYWGSVKELELKIEIMERLLALKANKSITKINLSNPISPIVSK